MKQMEVTILGQSYLLGCPTRVKNAVVTSFCFPFNCASGTPARAPTARIVVRRDLYNRATLSHPPSAMSKIEELADRVERLLLRHAELQRTSALLEKQVTDVTHERDNLRSRLNAARSRIDALLERLPAEVAAAPDAGHTEGTKS